MTNKTRLISSDSYEDMALSYQCLQVAKLDKAMQENGITDEATRQKICESFLWDMSIFHDQYWMKATKDAEPVYPLLCFSSRRLSPKGKTEELGEVFVPSETFVFHDYAHGNASLFYEDNSSAQVETGVDP